MAQRSLVSESVEQLEDARRRASYHLDDESSRAGDSYGPRRTFEAGSSCLNAGEEDGDT